MEAHFPLTATFAEIERLVGVAEKKKKKGATPSVGANVAPIVAMRAGDCRKTNCLGVDLFP